MTVTSTPHTRQEADSKRAFEHEHLSSFLINTHRMVRVHAAQRQSRRETCLGSGVRLGGFEHLSSLLIKPIHPHGYWCSRYRTPQPHADHMPLPQRRRFR